MNIRDFRALVPVVKNQEAMASTGLACAGSNEVRGAKVIVLGAGVAGLAAANRLIEHGFSDVTILEARGRPGGRTYSKPFGESYVDIGAQWIHGHEGNIIYQLAKEHNMVDEENPSVLEHSFVWPQLNEEQSSVASEVNSVVLEALDKCLQLSLSHAKGTSFSVLPKSVGHFLRRKLLDYIRDNDITGERAQLVEACYDWAVRFQNEIQGCSSLTDVSALFFGEYHECKGNTVTELKHGYGAVVDILLRDIPTHWLQYDKVVTSISVSLAMLSSNNFLPVRKSSSHLKTSFAAVPLGSNKPQITVTCQDGSTYKADHVVVTLPLGCLKATASHLFDPPLPEKKLLAIRSLGFGTLNKVFLQYEKPFWKPDQVFQVLWLDGLNHCGNKVETDDMSAWVTHSQLKTSWFRYIGRFTAVRHHHDLLCAWVTGEGAKFMETLSDQDVLSSCHDVLCQVLKNPDLPPPYRVERTAWNSDPYTRGSYSYISVACDATGSLPRDLAEPICECIVHFDTEVTYPTVLFAGEATHPHFHSTVHGAYESGIREADRLADFYFKAGSSQEPPCNVADELEGMFSRKELVPSGMSNPRVVIVGAGAAGLSAAYKLTLKGRTNFVILEAQSTAGGRILSYYYEDKVLELGAQWVHGEEGNLLYGFAMSNGLLADPRRQSSLEGRGHFCTDQGVRLPKDLVDSVVAVLDQIKEELCGKKARNADAKSIAPEPFVLNELPTSVGEYMRSRFHEHLLQQDEQEDMAKIKWAIYDWYWRFEVIDNSCYTLDELSCKSYEEFEDCPGVRNINFKNGFSSVVKTLLDKIPAANLRYNKPVKRVHWDGMPTATRQTKTPRSSISNSQETIRENVPFVECEDGEIILCRHVLLTVSAGYLKHHVDDMFQPRLPDKKRQALKGIGFGTINKIYLLFSNPFWGAGDEGFQLIWLDNQLDERDWWLRGISGFDPVYGNPNALVAWIGGHASEHMETLTDAQVSEACVRVLCMFLGRDVPEPKAVVRSFWNSNPYILGSYSNRQLPYEASETLLETFYEPLVLDVPLHRVAKVEWPLVLFAGEATDKDFYSTVHGAMRSGFREADRLINFWRKREEMIRESSAPVAS